MTVHRDETQASHQVVLQGHLDHGDSFGISTCNGESRAAIPNRSLWSSHPAPAAAELGKTCLAAAARKGQLWSPFPFPALWFGMAQGV